MEETKKLIDQIIHHTGEIILGKQHTIRLAVACLLSHGHLLIEDLPGLGKTTLAQTLAAVLGLGFHRIQFTSDMLPADILGVSVFDRDQGAFRFHPGPIFAQLILADEINRATPKAQSALLEAMEERQVTVEGETRPLPSPFFVIATQNPQHMVGTFPLPESQLDRFLMSIDMGYPERQAERSLLAGRNRREMIKEIQPVIDLETLIGLQRQVLTIHVSDALLDYLQALLGFSRESSCFHTGLSPRAGVALLTCARAWAMMHGRDHVLPEDIQAVLAGVAGHRLSLRDAHLENASQDPVRLLMENVSIP
ncbi:MAG: AAA family ATPase [Gammaproteobacteria bacterium]|nr:MAG: AAA family ATPase [Gammaproteobacteria bacterium]